MKIFHRQQFTRLWITLQSNEELGVLDSGFLEDYFGVNEQLTLHKMSDDTRTPILMNSVVGLDDPTPMLPNDVFTGFVELSDLENGTYFIEGCVRDVVGNYTVLTASQNRAPDLPTTTLELRITSSQIIVVFPKVASIQLGILLAVPILKTVVFDAQMKKTKVFNTKMEKSSVLVSPIVKYKTLETVMKKGLQLDAKLDKTKQLDAPLNILYDGK
jgi:hypothetical protein